MLEAWLLSFEGNVAQLIFHSTWVLIGIISAIAVIVHHSLAFITNGDISLCKSKSDYVGYPLMVGFIALVGGAAVSLVVTIMYRVGLSINLTVWGIFLGMYLARKMYAFKKEYNEHIKRMHKEK